MKEDIALRVAQPPAQQVSARLKGLRQLVEAHFSKEIAWSLRLTLQVIRSKLIQSLLLFNANIAVNLIERHEKASGDGQQVFNLCLQRRVVTKSKRRGAFQPYVKHGIVTL